MFSEHEPHARRYMALAESHAALEAENKLLRAEVGRLRNVLNCELRAAYASMMRAHLDAPFDRFLNELTIARARIVMKLRTEGLEDDTP